MPYVLVKLISSFVASVVTFVTAVGVLFAQMEFTDISTWLVGTPVVATAIVVVRIFIHTVREVREAASEARSAYIDEIARRDAEIERLWKRINELQGIGE